MKVNDIFNEQLVERKQNMTDNLKRITILAGGVIVLAVAFLTPGLRNLIYIIAIGVILCVVFLFRRFNVEYEYIFTNGELDIDQIINKNRRKRLLSVHVDNFIIMVPISNKDYGKDVEKYSKLYDVSSGVLQENTYAAIFDKDSKKIKLIFEPNEKIFDAIRAYIPRKIKK
ncbi:DUF6106 family protein [Petrocella sp. FN5]|uniref:DUF6106 family protein n=1 Tax=Petrocella sp. FN5 TaxID=3032002 RepID=UPI0023DBC8FE|nr:DUF6106 family protein [Petrocella sp. FN5]MDF1616694.1 DUF6106 family protein [Petrocella sp. FN5]